MNCSNRTQASSENAEPGPKWSDFGPVCRETKGSEHNMTAAVGRLFHIWTPLVVCVHGATVGSSGTSIGALKNT